MKIAILGTGPSAAYSAMACEGHPAEVKIISNTSPPTFFPGAFWPRLNPTDRKIPFSKVYVSWTGDVIGYLKKQWGMVDPDWLKETSFPKESSFEYAYDPYELFTEFWRTKDIHLSGILSDNDVADIAKQYDMVFMTFPTEKSKKALEAFTIKCPVVSHKTNRIMSQYCIYDGTNEEFTVRMSCLFGYIHTEYSKEYIPKVELMASGRVSWISDTMPSTPAWDLKDTPADNVVLIGRYAQWDRKVLAHHAYAEVDNLLEIL